MSKVDRVDATVLVPICIGTVSRPIGKKVRVMLDLGRTGVGGQNINIHRRHSGVR